MMRDRPYWRAHAGIAPGSPRLSLPSIARIDTTDAAQSVVRQALDAVEANRTLVVRTGWSSSLRQDSTDRAALLGLATLAAYVRLLTFPFLSAWLVAS